MRMSCLISLRLNPCRSFCCDYSAFECHEIAAEENQFAENGANESLTGGHEPMRQLRSSSKRKSTATESESQAPPKRSKYAIESSQTANIAATMARAAKRAAARHKQRKTEYAKRYRAQEKLKHKAKFRL